jgi:arylsulfatase A-like enzyme
MKKPNILLIITDQQHASMMSCSGNKGLNTPNIDSLALKGMRFTRAYCTNPVCIPSRFSLMTGRMPSTINLWSNSMENALPFSQEMKSLGIGHCIRNAGYKTLYGGKVHLPFETSPEEIGFTTYSTDERKCLAESTYSLLQEKHDKPFFMVVSFINPHDICYKAIRENPGTPSMTNILANSQIELDTLAEALALSGDSELPSNIAPQADEPGAITTLLQKQPWRKHAREKWDDKAWLQHRHAYARLTEMVDKEIGVVLDGLTDADLWRDTIVIFTSDHGELQGSHRLEQKIIPYREAIEVPLIIVDPSALSNVVNETHLVSNGLDLFPTIASYAGAYIPPFLEGYSLRPLVNGYENPWRPTLHIESLIASTTIGDKWIYSLYNEGENREQLYDLVNDPGQKRNALPDVLSGKGCILA